MNIMFVITQRPAALTGHLSAAHSTLQTTTELDFREALSPLPTPPRSVLAPYTLTPQHHTSRNQILMEQKPDAIAWTTHSDTAYRNSGCAETEELRLQVVDHLWEDLNPLQVSPRTWLLLFPLSKTTGVMCQRKLSAGNNTLFAPHYFLPCHEILTSVICVQAGN